MRESVATFPVIGNAIDGKGSLSGRKKRKEQESTGEGQYLASRAMSGASHVLLV
jgi:hypothetical protein